MSPYTLRLSPRLVAVRLRAAIFHFHERRLPFLIYISSSPCHFSLYASALLSVRGDTLARCYFSSARAPPLISHLFVLPSLLSPPCMPPLSQRLGVTHLRATIFHLHAHALQFLIYFSYPSSCFPLYASTLPAIRGYTLARCYFASARARPSISY